jgi:hypothetical protein
MVVEDIVSVCARGCVDGGCLRTGSKIGLKYIKYLIHSFTRLRDSMFMLVKVVTHIG